MFNSYNYDKIIDFRVFVSETDIFMMKWNNSY